MSSQTTTPKWLNEEFIKRALEKSEGRQIKVNKIQVQAATSPGDNYSSIMYRVTTEFNQDNDDEVFLTRSLIVKAIPEDERVKENLINNDAFTTEIQVLWNILPALHRLLNTSLIYNNILFGPRCYLFSDKPHQKLVMEDLCQSGFKMVPKMPGLDLDHCRLVVSRLSMFHAASIALHSKHPEMFENLLTHICVRTGETMGKFIANSFNAVAGKVQTLSKKSRKYYDKLNQLSKTALGRLVNSVQRDDKGFNVLIHGDLWTNNMMFKCNKDGAVSNMIFLDFQCSYYGSPALDLQYFLYTSPTPEVRSRYKDDLLEFYHASLLKNLVNLNVSSHCPSLEELYDEMEKRNFMGVFAFFCIKAIASAEPNKAADLNKLLEDPSETTSSAHLTEQFCKELEEILPVFDKEGFLD